MEEKYLRAEEQEAAKNLAFLTKNVSNKTDGARLQRAVFGREERLKSEKIIEQLFKEGKAVHSNCLTLVYLPVSLSVKGPVQAMFSVSKRHFKHAVDRNRLKRQLREAYRLQKNAFYEKLLPSETKLAICFVYKTKLKNSYSQIASEMNSLTQIMLQRLGA